MSSEAICLILDVGSSASRKFPVPGGAPGASRSFLDAALECASFFLERKLFSEAKDDFCIVLFGTEDTENTLDYDNVKVLERGYAPVDWESIQFLRNQVHGTNIESDWTSALIVALDTIRTARENKKYEALKLVLLSDLGGEAQIDDLEHIIKSIKILDNLDFIYIGTDQLMKYTREDGDEDSVQSQYEEANGQDETNGHEEANGHDGLDNRNGNDGAGPGTSRNGLDAKPLTKMQKLNKLSVGHLIVQVEGTQVTLDDAVAAFFYKNKKGKKPTAWKVNLEIGPDIKISTTGYVKMRRETPKTWKNCLAENENQETPDAIPGTSTDDVVEVRAKTRYVINNEDQEEVTDPAQITMAYSYGKTMVEMTDADLEMCKVETTGKSMSLIGFVDSGEISMSDLTGNGSMVFIPSEGDDNSLQALSALVQGMTELGVVGIVRRVYRKGSGPIMGVIAPEKDEEGNIYLAYSELPFSDERRLLQFPSLNNPKHPLTEEQKDAVDDLIDMMPMPDFEWRPETELNPQYQYLYQALTHRALNGDTELPKVPERLKEKLKPSESAVSEASEVIQNLIRLFPTEEVEQKTKRTAETVFGSDDKTGEPEAKKARKDDAAGNLNLLGNNQSQDEGETIIICVGSVNPVEDFEYLLSHTNTTGATIQSAGSQMEEIVQKFVASAFGSDLNVKIIKCLKSYRRACVARSEATLYNNFIRLMKTIASSKLWEAISQDSETGLVRQSEVVEGGVQDTEADTFFQPNMNTQPEMENEEDDEDLL